MNYRSRISSRTSIFLQIMAKIWFVFKRPSQLRFELFIKNKMYLQIPRGCSNRLFFSKRSTKIIPKTNKYTKLLRKSAVRKFKIIPRSYKNYFRSTNYKNESYAIREQSGTFKLEKPNGSENSYYKNSRSKSHLAPLQRNIQSKSTVEIIFTKIVIS